jgi:ribosomal protein S18 acetylase RimI-like enzyme
MDIQYIARLPKKNEFWKLFAETGWNMNYKLSKNELEQSLKSSWYAVSAYEKDKLVGFGRVISDGVNHAFIVDMIISQSHQGNGIGRMILNMLLDRCKEFNLRDIQLFAAKDKYGFYEKFGFEKRPEDAPGMQYK